MGNARRCPQCGEPVTPFAAGCAICGTDLDAHRRREAERQARIPTVRTPALPRPNVSPDVLAVGVCLLAAIFFPILALIMAIVWARDPMRANVRPALIACAILAAILFALPSLRYGVFSLLG